MVFARDGVLEDTFWSPWPQRSSPWPWPQGLEASSPLKLACPRLEDSSIFWIVKILWSAWKIFWKTFFCGDRLKNFCEDLFFFFFFFLRSPEKLLSRPFFFILESTCACVLGLEHSCPWPRECLFSERLSLASRVSVLGKAVLGLGFFFVSLALSLVSSTPPLVFALLLWKESILFWTADFTLFFIVLSRGQH